VSKRNDADLKDRQRAVTMEETDDRPGGFDDENAHGEAEQEEESKRTARVSRAKAFPKELPGLRRLLEANDQRQRRRRDAREQISISHFGPGCEVGEVSKEIPSSRLLCTAVEDEGARHAVAERRAGCSKSVHSPPVQRSASSNSKVEKKRLGHFLLREKDTDPQERPSARLSVMHHFGGRLRDPLGRSRFLDLRSRRIACSRSRARRS